MTVDRTHKNYLDQFNKAFQVPLNKLIDSIDELKQTHTKKTDKHSSKTAKDKSRNSILQMLTQHTQALFDSFSGLKIDKNFSQNRTNFYAQLIHIQSFIISELFKGKKSYLKEPKLKRRSFFSKINNALQQCKTLTNICDIYASRLDIIEKSINPELTKPKSTDKKKTIASQDEKPSLSLGYSDSDILSDAMPALEAGELDTSGRAKATPVSTALSSISSTPLRPSNSTLNNTQETRIPIDLPPSSSVINGKLSPPTPSTSETLQPIPESKSSVGLHVSPSSLNRVTGIPASTSSLDPGAGIPASASLLNSPSRFFKPPPSRGVMVIPPSSSSFPSSNSDLSFVKGASGVG